MTTKICKYCNSPVMVVPDKKSPVVKKRHVRNWGVAKPTWSYSMCYSKAIHLDVCQYHYKQSKLKRGKIKRIRRK